MIGHEINSFRTLSESQLRDFVFNEFQITGSYSQDNTPSNKIEFKKGSSISENIHDYQNVFYADTDNWDPQESDININQQFSIGKDALVSLFDGENVIAGEEDILGICVKWHFEPFSICGISEAKISLPSFTKKELISAYPNVKFEFSINFKKGEYGGALKLQYYLILKDKKSVFQNGIACENGTLLGTLNEEITVYFNGEGSSFPLSFFENNDENYLLWKINLPGSASDLNHLPFTDEYIGILINKSHPSYIFKDERDFIKSDLFKEVFSSALEHILYELYLMFRSEESLIEDTFLQESIDNSIAMFFSNCMDNLFNKKNIFENIHEEDISLEEFHHNVRNYVEKRVGYLR